MDMRERFLLPLPLLLPFLKIGWIIRNVSLFLSNKTINQILFKIDWWCYIVNVKYWPIYKRRYSFRISKRVQFFLSLSISHYPQTVGKLELKTKRNPSDQLKPLSVSRMQHRLHRRRHRLSIFEISITHTSVPTPLSRSVPLSPISVLRVSPTRGKSTHARTQSEENCLSRGRETSRPPFRGIARNMRRI